MHQKRARAHTAWSCGLGWYLFLLIVTLLLLFVGQARQFLRLDHRWRGIDELGDPLLVAC